MRRIGAGFLALVMGATLAVGPYADEAYACSCTGTLSVEEELRTSDAVFSGEVASIEGRELAPGSGPPLGRVAFKAEEVWKGESQQEMVVYGYGDEVSCGIDFERGKSYLV